MDADPAPRWQRPFSLPDGQNPDGGLKEIEAPNVDRDIQVSKDFAGRVFAQRKSHKWFNVPAKAT